MKLVAATALALVLLGCSGAPAPNAGSDAALVQLSALRVADREFQNISVASLIVCPEDEEKPKLIPAEHCVLLDTAGVAADEAWKKAAQALISNQNVDAAFADMAIKLAMLKATWETVKP